ncbi:CocE/NonD family hydrolase [Nevskia sp.]|uniref:alpha/beta hydrolase family protein n=1 Tax=Nevskia sp. TaxID=1929292 RepID=UPI0025D7504A|nr:CocE/NonD family hydrolase [Nevskia sp.]
MHPILRAALCASALILTACGNGGDGGSARPPTAACANPTAAQALDRTLDVDLPTDSDPSTNPTRPSTIHYTLLLPPRCPGDVFPIVLHSHGYGGSRLTALAANGDLSAVRAAAHFPSIEMLARALPFHGYAVISVDQRGHGDSAATTNARIIDPLLEIQDLRRLLDWAYDNAETFNFERQTGTGVDRDLNVGTLGVSYGGGFQMPLAALDARIDAIVPNGTWNNLLYSLLPGDGVKLSFDGLLCLLSTTGGVENTPVVAALCNQVSPSNLLASTIRTREDLTAALGRPTSQPRAVAPEEIDPFFFSHSTRYLETRQAANAPWGFGEASARLRAVPALFLQGNRDVLFNLTEGVWNADYFRAAGADVRLLSTEGGHMNPLANQIEGTANCGTIVGVDAVLAWYARWLKGSRTAAFDSLPEVCISVAATVDGQPGGSPAGLAIDRVPVGSLSGTGALPATLATAVASVGQPLGSPPSFVPVLTVPSGGYVLAGVPRLGSVEVVRGGSLLPRAAIAFVGVGIRRNGSLILVDEQLTPFVEGLHTSNRGQQNERIALPGVGEILESGDEVGLLFYEQQVQYAAVVSALSVPNLANVVNIALGTAIPAIGSALDTNLVAAPNPYQATVTAIELPILRPGEYPASRLIR